MSDGVATLGGAVADTCSRKAAATICWIAPSKAGDNSSVDVFEDVLRRGGSVAGPTSHGGGGARIRVTGVDPASVGVGVLLRPPVELVYHWGRLQPFACLKDGWDFLWELTPVTHKLFHRWRQLMRVILARV
ncbi:UNVERIFIED_CONTAM: hypothetical protein Slati_2169800 [Sesamum latifolium]|uniref:Uncharacterized protein n=1 Tax=Sesamum latifolium TaxID=2727402 RepID=A0AAW2WT75_9LAMI